MNKVLEFKTFNSPLDLTKWVNESSFTINIKGITPIRRIRRSEEGLTLFYYREI